MALDIKRTTETYLCARLTELVPGHTFYPFSGLASGQNIEPPFTVISISEAERAMSTEGTWIAQGTAQVVSHSAEATSDAHSANSREVYAALGNLPPEPMAGAFTFHGLDITGTTTKQDSESEAFADVINFAIGVGG